MQAGPNRPRGVLIGREAATPTNRIVELDVLRAVAIAAIVVCHLRNVTPQLAQSSIVPVFEVMVGDAALGLFFFLSGHALMLKSRETREDAGIVAFVKRRAVRIYPLYWLALVLTLLAQSLLFRDLSSFNQVTIENASQLLICAAGLQAMFKNVFVDQNIGIFWFVGTILLYYLMFPIILRLAARLRMPFTRSVLLVSLALYLALAFIALMTRTFDDRIFSFYWFFIAGMVMGRGMNMLDVRPYRLVGLCSLSLSGLAALWASWWMVLVNLGWSGFPALFDIVRFSTTVLLGVVGVTLSLLLVKLIVRRSGGPRDVRVQRIGRCSYSIYLFHLLVLEAVAFATMALQPMLVPVTVIALGVPLALLLPPRIEEVMRRALSKARANMGAVGWAMRR